MEGQTRPCAQIPCPPAKLQREAESALGCLGRRYCGRNFRGPLVPRGPQLNRAGGRTHFAPVALRAIKAFSRAAVIADEYFFSHLNGSYVSSPSLPSPVFDRTNLPFEDSCHVPYLILNRASHLFGRASSFFLPFRGSVARRLDLPLRRRVLQWQSYAVQKYYSAGGRQDFDFSGKTGCARSAGDSFYPW